ncbi:MAG TPA: type II toxin-antitoxin system RelE/ParE family toxin [Acetobacteraceae bacterium]|nr:type II toxin-antitoxin system RelE/ParE family toxin [Acetobacteraceae bacterium]
MFPRRGRPAKDGSRELLAVRPYIIVYDVDAKGNVEILRIWHAAQDR